MGFTSNETLHGNGGKGHHSFGLFAEYFAFPEKFLFFDIERLDAKILLGVGRTLDIYLYFDDAPDQLERSVDVDTFRLFCTPATNTFDMTAEPIRIDGLRTEYRVVPSARREGALEVIRVQEVSLAEDGKDPEPCDPFFSINRERRESANFWQSHRRSSANPEGGDDVFLSFVGTSQRDTVHSAVASVKIKCGNRNLPSKLPFGGGQPSLSLVDARPEIGSIGCLVAPTRTLRHQRGKASYWRLISQLTLNHLSISDGEDGAKALKEMLSVHDFIASAETKSVIDKLKSIESSPATARAPGGGRLAFCSGVDVRLTLDDERFSGTGNFLLACILEHFLGRYCTINSFSRLQVDLWKERKMLCRFPARAGDIALI